ncbi:uncharacterized protein LOC131952980 [Physella acuta]|uniref:uncharacterized protein LOC131952980 n=1 Tax=Physella acuta TaxID=109671 RepID=UPI0027DCD812|nr:uncharacterized protein LOC131952980 [Physella acuta]
MDVESAIEESIRRIISQHDINVITKRMVRSIYMWHSGAESLTQHESDVINKVLNNIVITLAHSQGIDPTHSSLLETYTKEYRGGSHKSSNDGSQKSSNDGSQKSSSHVQTPPDYLMKVKNNVPCGQAEQLHKKNLTFDLKEESANPGMLEESANPGMLEESANQTDESDVSDCCTHKNNAGAKTCQNKSSNKSRHFQDIFENISILATPDAAMGKPERVDISTTEVATSANWSGPSGPFNKRSCCRTLFHSPAYKNSSVYKCAEVNSSRAGHPMAAIPCSHFYKSLWPGSPRADHIEVNQSLAGGSTGQVNSQDKLEDHSHNKSSQSTQSFKFEPKKKLSPQNMANVSIKNPNSDYQNNASLPVTCAKSLPKKEVRIQVIPTRATDVLTIKRLSPVIEEPVKKLKLSSHKKECSDFNTSATICGRGTNGGARWVHIKVVPENDKSVSQICDATLKNFDLSILSQQC